MTGHRPFGKICYESERKLEKGKCKVWHTICSTTEGIIEDLIAQHDF